MCVCVDMYYIVGTHISYGDKMHVPIKSLFFFRVKVWTKFRFWCKLGLELWQVVVIYGLGTSPGNKCLCHVPQKVMEKRLCVCVCYCKICDK